MSKIFEALQRAQKQTAAAAAAGPDDALSAGVFPVSGVPVDLIPVSAPEPGPGLTTPGTTAGIASSFVGEEGSPARTEAGRPAEIESFPATCRAIVASDPASAAAEQYRVLRTNILKLAENSALKVVLIASPGPGDGKTLTALNLALTFGQKPDTRVLLIEADMRKPGLSALLDLEQRMGLSNYLGGEGEFEGLLHCIAPGVLLLPSGPVAATPADLLHSPRMETLFVKARQQFDWVVMDGPPIHMLADHDLLAAHSDGVVLIVRPLHTSRELLRLAMQSLQDKNVLGVVINATQVRHRYGSYYGYGYGSTGYGKPSRNGRKNKSGKDEEKKKKAR